MQPRTPLMNAQRSFFVNMTIPVIFVRCENLIYELTSYINEGEAITEELVQLTFAKLNNRNEFAASSSGSSRKELSVDDVSAVRMVPESLLSSIARQETLSYRLKCAYFGKVKRSSSGPRELNVAA